MAKYNIYAGKFKCQECNIEVSSLRSYPDNKELTWMCSERHLSVVSLDASKSRRKNDREK